MYDDSINRNDKLPALKLTIAQYLILVMMLGLCAGLWRLQILGADNYRSLAEQNRIKKVPVLAPRGRLYDREGRLVVDNYPSVTCFIIREQHRDLEPDLPLISQGLHLDLDQLRATLHRYRVQPGYQPIPIKQDITADELAFVESHRNELPELETIDEERRLYPADGYAAHLIGYVGEVSEEMLNDPRYAWYEPGDVVGKAGIEQSYDAVLRGEDGSREEIVDSKGHVEGYLGMVHAKPGQDLKLTIDIDVQRAAELAMGSNNGAVVAMDPRNGEILALVSHPSYDPNAFAVRIGRQEWNRLITDPNHPLMNKAIQDQLAPGSTFKIAMSVAGLQEGVAQTMRVMCNHGGTFYGRFFKCDRAHGMVDIEHAIPWSCDTFYYALAEKLGIETIAKYAHALGLGQRTGIDLPNEMAGVVPSEEWKLKTFHEKWYAGEAISVGIGQGALQVTPLQLARMIGGVASDGHLVRPHVVMPGQISSQMMQEVSENYPGTGDKSIHLEDDNWMTITDGMANVLNPSMGGTASAAHLEGVDFAGKTGTAQVVGSGDTHVKGGAHTPNAWFVGVVPRRNPEIVVAVLQEHGDWGSNSAKLAEQVIAAYINKQRKKDNNILQVKQATPAIQDGKPSPVPATSAPANQEKPVEVGAIWTGNDNGEDGTPAVHAGRFFVGKDSKVFTRHQITKSLPAAAAVLPARYTTLISGDTH